jgi:hypothetical protein
MYVTGLHCITVVDMANSSGTGDCRPTPLNVGPGRYGRGLAFVRRHCLATSKAALLGYVEGSAIAARFQAYGPGRCC